MNKEKGLIFDNEKENNIPAIIKDIELIRLLLPSLDLYTLKFFFTVSKPITIRYLYTQTIHFIFNYCFKIYDKKPITNKDSKMILKGKRIEEIFIPSLVESGYADLVINKKDASKIVDEVYSKKKEKSFTYLTEEYIKILKKKKVKIPSYDKFKSIVDNFEKNGLVIRASTDNKSILYTLNPIFYKALKDKKEKILEL